MERDLTIDALKGISIFLVVFAHIIYMRYGDTCCVDIVYSFHMPIFFIVSGFFVDKLKVKNILKLFILYFLINVIVLFIRIYFNQEDWTFKDAINSFIWNGANNRNVLFSDIHSIGTSWFLVAIGISKLLFCFF